MMDLLNVLARGAIALFLFFVAFAIFVQRMKRQDRSEQQLRDLTQGLARIQDRIEHGTDHRGERAPRTRRRKPPRWKNK